MGHPQPVAQPPALLGWIRDRLTTTPGRLTLASVAVVAAALVFGVVAVGAERAREGAARAVASQTEPLLLGSVRLNASLSHADATATTTFLTGGLEPPDRRAIYVADLDSASTALAAVSRQSTGSDSTREAVSTITNRLPTYSGLIEAARANNRLGFPIGAAYQRQASALLAKTILPAADELYKTEATNLERDYRAGAATASLVAFAAASLLALLLLILAQVHLARISRRLLNVPMLAATLLLAALSGLGIGGLLGEQNALASARHAGSDSVEVLSAARILASRAQSYESLALVARGGDPQPSEEFVAVMRALAGADGRGGILADVDAQARLTGTGPAAAELARTLAAYRAQHQRILDLVAGGHFRQAVALEGASSTSSSLADRLSANLDAQINIAEARFVHDAGRATGALAGLAVTIPLATLLAAALALVGLRQRLNEYR